MKLGLPGASPGSIFAPVRSQTAFEETLERLGTAIKLGLLEPGDRLPAERVLCRQLGISRSTLRQALTALVQSGHLHATRGRSGGTFVAESPPPVDRPSAALLAGWRDACDQRLAVELAVAMLAAERAEPASLAPLDELVAVMDATLEDFSTYRQADVRWHIVLAEAAGGRRLLAAMTEAQGQMSDLIAHIAHPPELLAWSNQQHARLIAAVRRRDGVRAVQIMGEHLKGTVHVLAGLLPPAGEPDPERTAPDFRPAAPIQSRVK
ncbi:MAG TPA: FCD domain-containing protein [Solirubrobacteraceae bacterium]|nr:FCD domain-containing protein [Solirubrobacteraceae bacterium]